MRQLDLIIKSKKEIKQIFDFSVSSSYKLKENKKMSSKSSLDEKMSDLVGSSNYKFNDKIKIKYDFAVDQNYNDLNYNDLGLSLNYDRINFNFSYFKKINILEIKNILKLKLIYQVKIIKF